MALLITKQTELYVVDRLLASQEGGAASNVARSKTMLMNITRDVRTTVVLYN